MNNCEWLMNMTYEQRGEWLEAEHVESNDAIGTESDVRPEMADANDSREKLEADVRKCFDPPEQQMIIRWLDRQAEITSNETSHDNPYVGLVRGKQWERTEISDYYCGRCGWKVTDHDSYCPECGGALHKAPNKPDGKSDAPKTAESGEIRASKDDIRDFDDSREKLEADCTAAWKSVERIVRSGGTPKDRWTNSEFFKLLDRQAAITYSIDAWYIEKLENDRESLQDQVDDLQANLNRANDAFETARLELEEQIADLERECDDLHSRIEQWMNAAASYRDLWERADARRIEAECERDGLAIALKHSDAEREHYRNLNSELMGVFDDARHVVARYENDEGLA